MSQLTLYLFGHPRLELDGNPIHITRRKAIALLAFLAVSGQSHSRDWLATLLWPESSQSKARGSLRSALSLLNRQLGENWLQTDRETAGRNTQNELSVDHIFWLDVTTFQQKLEVCEDHDHPTTGACPDCIPALEEAVALYQDNFMAGFSLKDCPAYDEWQFFQGEELRERLANALICLLNHYSQAADYETAISYARRWLVLDPLHEPAHQQLMVLYYQAGQRAAALRQYQLCRQALEDELGVPPSQETIDLYEHIRAKDLSAETPQVILPVVEIDSPPLSSESRTGHNLPLELTSFIGRENEISQVKELLSQNRLVTLTGVGGTGKTRLSLQVAGQVLDNYANGAWLVELAGLSDPAMVPRTVASALNLTEIAGKRLMDTLVDFLREKHLLLILDNCEHLLEACSSLAERLLRSCPKITILASSREFLGVTGEVPYRLPPMALPVLQARSDPEQLAAFDAIQLFTERAQVVIPDFAVTADNAAAVVQVVNRLDGLPLAIELAAARLRLLSVTQVAQRLEDAFRLLTGGGRSTLPRHQTLRASIDWSYNLLSQVERTLLRRLSVFAGSWRISAAEQVCANLTGSGDLIHPDQVLDLVTGLLDKSLIQTVRRPDGMNRFRMLETVRQYAHEKLVDEGESQAARDCHLKYYLRWVKEIVPKIRGRGQVQTLDRLEGELDNLRLALEWALREDVEAELEMATALQDFWEICSREPEGIRWLEQGLELAEMVRDNQQSHLDEVDPLVRAGAMTSLGSFRVGQYIQVSLQVDYAPEQAKDLFEKAVTLYQSLDPESNREAKLGLVRAELGLAGGTSDLALFLYDNEWKREHARVQAEAAIDIFRAAGDLPGEAECLHLLINLSDSSDQQIQLCQEYLAICEKMGDPASISDAYRVLGYKALERGEYSFALESYKASLKYARQLNELNGISYSNLMMGVSFQALGDLASAEDHLQRSLLGWREIGLENRVLWSLEAISELRIAQGRYDQAAALNDQAWEIAQRSGVDVLFANAIMLRTRLARQRGDLALAQKHLNALPPLEGIFFYHRIMVPIEWGNLALQSGDLAQAGRRLREALTLINISYEMYLTPFFDGLALYAARTSRIEAAARLFGSPWCRAYVNFLSPIEKEWHQSDWDAMQAALGEQHFEQLFEQGKSMTYEQTVDLAREILSQEG